VARTADSHLPLAARMVNGAVQTLLLLGVAGGCLLNPGRAPDLALV